MRKVIGFGLVLGLLLTGCASQSPSQPSSIPSEQTVSDSSSIAQSAEFAQSDSEMFTRRDLDAAYDAAQSVQIHLAGDSIQCDAPGVTVSGTTATLTREAVYVVSGSLQDGSILVDAEESAKIQLVLDGAQIHSEASAPLVVLKADKVFVTLAEGSENRLSGGSSFDELQGNHIDGTVFSKQDLTFNGSGRLQIASPSGHGIVCKDDVAFCGGEITVQATSHGVEAKDSVRLCATSLEIEAGRDGIHAENQEDASLGFVYMSGGALKIQSENDGLSAASTMQIAGGNVEILSGGGSENAEQKSRENFGGPMGGRPGPFGTTSQAESSETTESRKALKSAGAMLLSGGNFTLCSADDAVHSNTSITVEGGRFDIASGDDGFHADQTLSVLAGEIDITECYEGLEALDVSVQGGNIRLIAADDGINAAGGTDSSGFGGAQGGDRFGGPGGPGGMGGGPGGMSPGNGSITVSGGNLHITASGDGMDANGSLTISGGATTVCGPTQGDTATLDYDTTAVITGGSFIGTGALGMAQTFSDSEQGLLSVNVGNQSAGTTVTVSDKKGNQLLSYQPELSFGVLIFSSPQLVSGETYTVTVGSSSADFEAD